MSNTDSALVRSNLGRRTAVSAAANLAPALVDLLVKQTANAIRRYGTGGSGIQVVGDPSPPVVGRRRRNRRRRSGQAQQIPRAVGVGARLPSVRRVLKTVITLNCDASGNVNNVYAVGVADASTVPWQLLGSNLIGPTSAAYIQQYTSTRIHSVRMTLTPAMGPLAARYISSLGYTHRNFAAGGAVPDFKAVADLPTSKIGGPTGPIVLTFNPTNSHGGVVPNQSTRSDDFAELTCGCVAIQVSSSVTSASPVATLYIEADVTLLDV
jgi:hypothetical protein